ncbi:hypothetical protein DV515_00000750 [Chloebia gouldiae]|uniref:Uncharacterized protein n=1 Tax=Chloebia gouldiae TaxID=44316 RepID=A0A3L8T166_CHLGU|nr:hypothetical protein DV515_00000750 [Chloebia gouldiae]
MASLSMRWSLVNSRIVDLEVEQNQTQEETVPSSGLRIIFSKGIGAMPKNIKHFFLLIANQQFQRTTWAEQEDFLLLFGTSGLLSTQKPRRCSLGRKKI